MPQTFKQVYDLYQSKAPQIGDMSIQDFSKIANYVTNSNEYDTGLTDGIGGALKKGSYWINRGIDSTGIPEVTGTLGRSVFEAFGADGQAGYDVGASTPRMIGNFLPAMLTAGASAPVAAAGLAGAGLLSAWDAYGQDAPTSQVVAAGLAPAFGMGAMVAGRPLVNAAVGKLASIPGAKALGFVGPTVTQEAATAATAQAAGTVLGAPVLNTALRTIPERIAGYVGDNVAAISGVEALNVGITDKSLSEVFSKENILANVVGSIPFAIIDIPALTGPRAITSEAVLFPREITQTTKTQLTPERTAEYLAKSQELRKIKDQTERGWARVKLAADYEDVLTDPSFILVNKAKKAEVQKTATETPNLFLAKIQADIAELRTMVSKIKTAEDLEDFVGNVNAVSEKPQTFSTIKAKVDAQLNKGATEAEAVEAVAAAEVNSVETNPVQVATVRGQVAKGIRASRARATPRTPEEQAAINAARAAGGKLGGRKPGQTPANAKRAAEMDAWFKTPEGKEAEGIFSKMYAKAESMLDPGIPESVKKDFDTRFINAVGSFMQKELPAGWAAAKPKFQSYLYQAASNAYGYPKADVQHTNPDGTYIRFGTQAEAEAARTAKEAETLASIPKGDEPPVKWWVRKVQDENAWRLEATRNDRSFSIDAENAPELAADAPTSNLFQEMLEALNSSDPAVLAKLLSADPSGTVAKLVAEHTQDGKPTGKINTAEDVQMFLSKNTKVSDVAKVEEVQELPPEIVEAIAPPPVVEEPAVVPVAESPKAPGITAEEAQARLEALRARQAAAKAAKEAAKPAPVKTEPQVEAAVDEVLGTKAKDPDEQAANEVVLDETVKWIGEITVGEMPGIIARTAALRQQLAPLLNRSEGLTLQEFAAELNKFVRHSANIDDVASIVKMVESKKQAGRPVPKILPKNGAEALGAKVPEAGPTVDSTVAFRLEKITEIYNALPEGAKKVWGTDFLAKAEEYFRSGDFAVVQGKPTPAKNRLGEVMKLEVPVEARPMLSPPEAQTGVFSADLLKQLNGLSFTMRQITGENAGLFTKKVLISPDGNVIPIPDEKGHPHYIRESLPEYLTNGKPDVRKMVDEGWYWGSVSKDVKGNYKLIDGATPAWKGAFKSPDIVEARPMFVGPSSKMSAEQQTALSRAISLSQGAKDYAGLGNKGRKTIWDATGWMLGPEGKWRFSIDSTRSKLTDKFTEGANLVAAFSGIDVVNLSKAFDHPELYKLYPQLKDYKIEFYNDMDPWAPSGYFQEATNTIGLNAKTGLPSEHYRGILVHEIQHAIQGIEGFAKGDNPRSITPDTPGYAEIFDFYTNKGFDAKQADIEARYELYNRAFGEVEANESMRRLNFTSEELKFKMPYAHNDGLTWRVIYHKDGSFSLESSAPREPMQLSLEQLTRGVLLNNGWTPQAVDNFAMPFIAKMKDVLSVDGVQFGQLINDRLGNSGELLGLSTVNGLSRRIYLAAAKDAASRGQDEQLLGWGMNLAHEVGHSIEQAAMAGLLPEAAMQSRSAFRTWALENQADWHGVLNEFASTLPENVRRLQEMREMTNPKNVEEFEASAHSIWAMGQLASKGDLGMFAAISPQPVRGWFRTLARYGRDLVGAVKSSLFKLPFEATKKNSEAVSRLTDYFENIKVATNEAYAVMAEASSVLGLDAQGLSPLRMSELDFGADGKITFNTRSYRAAYEKVPDSLMGFPKSGPTKPFHEQKYPFTQWVKAEWSDGNNIVDAVKGLNSEHALERARRNWPDAKISVTEAPADTLTMRPMLTGETPREGKTKLLDFAARSMVHLEQLAARYPGIADMAYAVLDAPSTAKAFVSTAMEPIFGKYDPNTGRTEIDASRRPYIKMVAGETRVQQVVSDIHRWQNKFRMEFPLDQPAKVSQKLADKLNQLTSEERKAVRIWSEGQKRSQALVTNQLIASKTKDGSYAIAAALREMVEGKNAIKIVDQALAAVKEKDPVKQQQLMQQWMTELATGDKVKDQMHADFVHQLVTELHVSGEAFAKRLQGRPWYTPEIRTGTHLLRTYDTNGKQISVDGYSSQRELDALTAQGKSQGGVKFVSKKRERHYDVELGDDMTSALEALDNTMIRKLQDVLPANLVGRAQEFVDYMNLQGEVSRLSQAHLENPTIETRRLAEGRENLNMVAGWQHYVNTMGRVLSNRAAQSKMRYELADAKIRNGEYAGQVEQIQQTFKNYMQPDSEFARGLTKLNAVYHLGFNIPTHIAELSQGLSTVLPELVFQTGSVMQGTKMLGQVAKELAGFYAKKTGGKLMGKDEWTHWGNKQEREMLETLARRGRLDGHHTLENVNEDITSNLSLGNVAQKGMLGKAIDMTTAPLKVYADTSMNIYASFTRFNSRLAAISGYKLARQQGKSHLEAIDAADRFMVQTTFASGRAGRPPEFYKNSTVGAMLYSLQRYSLSWMSMYATHMKGAFADPKALLAAGQGTKGSHARALATMSLVQFGLAGALGLPFVSPLLTLLEDRLGIDIRGRSYSKLSDIMNSDEETGGYMADMVMRGGANALLERVGVPVDFGSRFNLSGLPGMNEFNGFDPGRVFGPTANLANAAFTGVTGMATGDTLGLTKSVAPVGLRKAVEYFVHGDAITSKGTRLGLQDNETAMYALGATPRRISKSRDAERILENQRQERLAKTNKAANEIAQLLQKDPAQARKKFQEHVGNGLEAGMLERESRKAYAAFARQVAEASVNQNFPKDIRDNIAAPDRKRAAATLQSMGVQLPSSNSVEEATLFNNVMSSLGQRVTPSRLASARQQAQWQDQMGSPW